jgi:glycosyltransferase involved in cell wall biosynthesis
MSSDASVPLVSIGIPTFNRRVYTLRAAKSALSQTYTKIEVIVSDNASTDDTIQHLSAIEDARLVILRHPENSGMVANFNSCLKAATGKLFLMLSDDDWLEPDAIEKLSRPYRESVRGIDPETVGMTWCPCVNVDADGKPLWTVRGGPFTESPVALLEGLFNGGRGPVFSSVMIRAEDGRAAGSYDENRYGVLCDTANWGKAALRHPCIVCFDEPLINYTIHTTTPSGTSSAICGDWQLWINRQVDDFSAIAKENGDFEGEKRILKCRKNVLANITVTVLMRYIGRSGWVRAFAREFWRSRSFMLTPFVAKRILKDGWKVLRLK